MLWSTNGLISQADLRSTLLQNLVACFNSICGGTLEDAKAEPSGCTEAENTLPALLDLSIEGSRLSGCGQAIRIYLIFLIDFLEGAWVVPSV